MVFNAKKYLKRISPPESITYSFLEILQNIWYRNISDTTGVSSFLTHCMLEFCLLMFIFCTVLAVKNDFYPGNNLNKGLPGSLSNFLTLQTHAYEYSKISCRNSQFYMMLLSKHFLNYAKA